MNKKLDFLFHTADILRLGKEDALTRVVIRTVLLYLPGIIRLVRKEPQLVWLFSEILRLIVSRDYLTPQKFEIELSQWTGKFKLWKDQNLFFSEEQDKAQNHQMNSNATEHSHLNRTPASDLGQFCLITPIFEFNELCFEKTFKSIAAQKYGNWLWLLLVDRRSTIEVEERLKGNTFKDRIFVRPSTDLENNLSIEYGKAIASCSCTFIGFLSSCDSLFAHSLESCAEYLMLNNNIAAIYSDEIASTDDDYVVASFNKPSWSIDLMQDVGYVQNLLVCRTAAIADLELQGRFEEDIKYDLILKLAEKKSVINHLPQILYRQFVPKSGYPKQFNLSALEESRKSLLTEHLQRTGVDGTVGQGIFLGSLRVKRVLSASPKISIIIPTKDKVELLRQCVDSIVNLSSYSNYEIIIIDNNSHEPATFDYFESSPHKLLQFPHPFNYSAINNYGVSSSTGEYLLFLNNDTEVITHDWLEAMLEHGQRSEVGVVGAKLLYPNGLVQHAGVITDEDNNPIHTNRFIAAYSHGYHGLVNSVRNLDAVTGACMLMRREVFQEVGGFDPQLQIVFNDIDLCFKVREAGYLIVYTPHSQLYHYEGISRSGHTVNPIFSDNMNTFKSRWQETLHHRMRADVGSFI